MTIPENENPYVSPKSKQDLNGLSNFKIDGFVRTCQIIVLSLIMGVVAFMVFGVYTMLQQGVALNWNLSTIAIAGLGLAASVVPASFVIPRMLGKPSTATTDTSDNARVESLLGAFQSQLIVGLALLEGSAFLNAMAFWQQHHPISFLTAIGLVGLMIFRFPTKNGVQNWLARNKQS